MRCLLHYIFARPGTRAFDAAGGGRRWERARTVDALSRAILAGATAHHGGTTGGVVSAHTNCASRRRATAWWAMMSVPGSSRNRPVRIGRGGINTNALNRTQRRKGSRLAGMNLGKSVFDSAFPTPVLSASRTFSQTDEKHHRKYPFIFNALKLSTKSAKSSALESIGPERTISGISA